MDTQDRLARALGLEYNVIVHRSKDGYVFFIRELGLRHTNANLEPGYSEISTLKDEWLRGLAEEGLWDWIVEPGERAAATAPTASGPFRNLLPFFIKLGCVSFVLLVLVAFVSSGLREVGYGLEKKLDSIVRMTPESVEQHRVKARAIAEKLRPILLELQGAFQAQAPELSSDQGNSTAPAVSARP